MAVLTLIVEHGVRLHRLMRTRAPRDTFPRSKSPLTNMQPEKRTSALGVDPPPDAIERHTTEHMEIAVSALELRLSSHIQASNTVSLAQLQCLTCSTVPTNQPPSIPPHATIATEGGKAAQYTPNDMMNDESELIEPGIADFSAYGTVIPAGLERPPRDIDEPRL